MMAVRQRASLVAAALLLCCVADDVVASPIAGLPKDFLRDQAVWGGIGGAASRSKCGALKHYPVILVHGDREGPESWFGKGDGKLASTLKAAGFGACELWALRIGRQGEPLRSLEELTDDVRFFIYHVLRYTAAPRVQLVGRGAGAVLIHAALKKYHLHSLVHSAVYLDGPFAGISRCTGESCLWGEPLCCALRPGSAFLRRMLLPSETPLALTSVVDHGRTGHLRYLAVGSSAATSLEGRNPEAGGWMLDGAWNLSVTTSSPAGILSSAALRPVLVRFLADQTRSCKPSDDADGDGFCATARGGNDCDDSDPKVFPGAREIHADGKDQDCNQHDHNPKVMGWKCEQPLGVKPVAAPDSERAPGKDKAPTEEIGGASGKEFGGLYQGNHGEFRSLRLRKYWQAGLVLSILWLGVVTALQLSGRLGRGQRSRWRGALFFGLMALGVAGVGYSAGKLLILHQEEPAAKEQPEEDWPTSLPVAPAVPTPGKLSAQGSQAHIRRQGGVAEKEEGKTVLNLGYTTAEPLPFAISEILAHTGIPERYGFRARYKSFARAKELLHASALGEVDVTFIDGIPAMESLHKLPGLSIIGCAGELGHVALVVPRSSKISDIKALASKTVAVVDRPSASLALKQWLATSSAGIGQALTLTQHPQDGRAAMEALLVGQASAAVLSDPWLTLYQSKHKLLVVKRAPAWSLLAAFDGFVPPTMEGKIRMAVADALAWGAEHLDETADLLQRRSSKLPRDIIKAVLKKNRHFSSPGRPSLKLDSVVAKHLFACEAHAREMGLVPRLFKLSSSR